MWRETLIFAGFLGAAGISFGAAGSSNSIPISQFSGLNTEDSPIRLQNGQSPDSQNVITDNGPGIEGRQGFIRFSTEPCAGLWSFPHSNGNRYVVCLSSGLNNLKASTSDGIFDIQISTTSSAQRTSVTSLGDKLFFANKTDGLKYWDTSTVTVASSTLTFSQIVTHKARIFGIGKSGSERTLFGSAFNDGTNFTLVTNPADTDPTQNVISGALDEAISGLYASFQDKLMFFKPHSFGALFGSSRIDFNLRTFSENVGSTYPETVQDCSGRLRWLGPDRTIWEFDGASFYKISEKTKTLLNTIAQGEAASHSVTYTTQADWETGNAPGSNLSTADSPGDVVFAGEERQTIDPDAGVISGRAQYAQSFNSTSGIYNPFATSRQKMYDASASTTITRTWTIRPDSAGAPSTVALATAAVTLSLTDAYQDFTAPTFSPVLTLLPNTTYWVDFASGTRLSTDPDYASVPRSVFQRHSGSAPEGIYTRGETNDFDPPSDFNYNDFYFIVASTQASATFQTSPINVGTGITSWGTFNVTSANDGGGQTFAVYADSNTSITVSNSATWVSSQTVVDGSMITLTTAPYATVTDVFTRTLTTQRPALSQFSFSWNEGSAIRAASGYPNQRYWMSVSISSSANNAVIVYDKLSQWQEYSGINASAIVSYGDDWLFSNNTGVFTAETGYNDNGTSISSYYTTPTFIPAGFGTRSYFDNLHVVTDNSDSTLTTTFKVDEVNTSYSLPNYAMNGDSGTQNVRFPFPASQLNQGKEINFKFSVSGSARWRILGMDFDFQPDKFAE